MTRIPHWGSYEKDSGWSLRDLHSYKRLDASCGGIGSSHLWRTPRKGELWQRALDPYRRSGEKRSKGHRQKKVSVQEKS
ncbi:hypothetical protein BHM03_00035354 [Ensete ventricosum]|nr:hypothetical protein BHM03_00035354 [Ensete ventricosum]